MIMKWNPESKNAKMITRTVIIVFVVEFLLCVLASALSGSRSNPNATLRNNKVLVGAAVDPTFLTEPQYAHTVAQQFSMIEPENAMKWWTIHPRKNEYDFTEGDAIVRFALQHNQKVRGHCLMWGALLPHWLGAPDVSSNLGTAMKNHIHIVVGHYKGQVFAWDVVNEIFATNGSIHKSYWYDSPGLNVGPGTAFVEKAFIWAHEADPNAKLFYNDFDVEEINPKSDAMYLMVKDFKVRGIPIDGVGFQCHLKLNGLNYESFRANIARFVALGVEVHITELDVAIPKYAVFGRARQARVYKAVVDSCLQTEGCTAIQFWGVTDKHSWIPEFTRGQAGSALLFDENYQPKPAYEEVAHSIAQGE
jgi:endo-1,4-beta-xylanase